MSFAECTQVEPPFLEKFTYSCDATFRRSRPQSNDADDAFAVVDK